MTEPPVFSEKLLLELPLLVERCVNGTAMPDQIAQLDRLMLESEEARKLYARYMYTLCSLRTWSEYPLVDSDSDADPATMFSDSDFIEAPPSPIFSVPLSWLGSSWNNTANFFSQEVPFALLMATLFMIFGGLLGSVMTVEHYAQMPGQPRPSVSDSFASNASADKTIQSEEEVKWVGRITGMVDCKWSNDKDYLPPGGDYVSLGRKYKLDSGLMEITYDTGAKVILQGPVTYEVESANGGYLSLGKLTARVEKKVESGEGRGERGEKKAEGGGWRAEEAAASLPSPSGRGAGGEGDAESNDRSALTLALSQRERGPDNPPSALRLPSSTSPQPLAPSPSSVPSPLFAVRTPTAIVTDLGTEFGVEVEKTGNTKSHVFQGRIVFVALAPNGEKQGRETVLDANESARTETKEGNVRVVVANDGELKPDEFVRREQLVAKIKENRELPLKPFHRWQAYSRELRKDPSLVAYYPIEQADGDLTSLRNAAATGSALDGHNVNVTWQPGRFPGKRSLQFRGAGFSDRVELPLDPRLKFTGSFSLAVWCKADRYSAFPEWSNLISKGSTSWRLMRWSSKQCLCIDTNIVDGTIDDITQTRVVSRRDILDDRWHCVVAVFEATGQTCRKRLYLDGRLDGAAKTARPMAVNDSPVRIGNEQGFEDGAFCGWIDEAAIFARAISNQEVQEMYSAGDPNAPVAGGENLSDIGKTIQKGNIDSSRREPDRL